jgi:hypothetical protein
MQYRRSPVSLASFRLTLIMAAFAAAGIGNVAVASSHREAPSIAMNPTVDATDVYLFRSYEPGRANFVTLIADYYPFQNNAGGANYYQFNPNALYEIHIDNTGSGSEALTFQFRFTNTSNAIAVPVGGKSTRIPLIHAGPSSSPGGAPVLNVNETYTLNLVRGDRRTGQSAAVTNAAGGAAVFTKPVDSLGDKTFGSPAGYAAYASKYVYDINIPGCPTPGRVFVGQRKDPFYLLDGKLFDLLNFNLLGPEVGGNNNDLEANNISTLALELPIACVTSGTDPVIGAWTTSSLRQGRLLSNPVGTGLNKVSKEGGAWTQVSRLGNPLFNEVIIGMDDKDRFNGAKPKDDIANFSDYITNPAFPTLIQTVYPQFKAPTNFPRGDLMTVFLKGIKGVNQPAHLATPSEMMRLNTSVAPTPLAMQNPLGVAGGDSAGYPNGRRPGDDVVDISIRAAMGLLCVLTGTGDSLALGCHPSDAPSGNLPFTDGVRKTAVNYGASFPYLTPPVTGSLNPVPAAGTSYP